MSGEVWVNDIDLGDYGFMGSPPIRSFTDAPVLADPMVITQGWPGPLWAGEPTLAQVRTVLVNGKVIAASNAALLAAVDNLRALCEDGAVRLRFADRPTQEYRDARCKEFSDSRRDLLLGLATELAIAFELANPQRFDMHPIGLGLSTSRIACPLGTAPSYPVILISGAGAAVTNPTITYRNAAGLVVQTMGFTGTIGANDFWRVDTTRAMITKSLAGTASDGISLWTGGDFPVLRPADAWFETTAWPTLELSASAGTPVGTVVYARQYQ